MTKLIALLPLFIGCGPIAVPPSGPAALSDADFDGWQGTASQEKQTIDPAQAGGILSTILDRVESIEAKLRPPSGIKPASRALVLVYRPLSQSDLATEGRVVGNW
jgi:hypothetical protein